MRIVWLTAAEASLEAQLDYIAAENPRAAIQQGDRVMAAVARLGRFAQSGRQGRVTGTRELVVPGTPFIVAYAVRAEDIVILRVLHGAQQWPPQLP